MKLSASQAKVIRLMQDGCSLRYFGCFVGHSGFSTRVTLEKHRENDYDFEERTTMNTVKALLRRGLIRVVTHKLGGDYETTTYELTEKGKTWGK